MFLKSQFYISFYEKLTSKEIWDGAAALSYYYMVSLFPFILVCLNLSTYFYYSPDNSEAAKWLEANLPADMKSTILQVVEQIKKSQDSNVWTLTYFFAVWTTLNALLATFRQLNTVYGKESHRSLIKERLVAILVSITFLVLVTLSSALSFIGNFFIKEFTNIFNLAYLTFISLMAFKYLLLILFSVGFFTSLYYWGTAQRVTLKHSLPGAFLATLIFLSSTEGFSFFLNHLANYSATYGSAGVIISLLLWLYIIGFAVIFGAEFNLILSQKKTHSEKE